MSRRISSPVFVGRIAELARVTELRNRVVATGHGEPVLVTGEAGLGKTRFLRELAARSEAAGSLVLWGACDEFSGSSRPFSALAEMTPALGQFLAEELPDELRRPAWLALEALASGLAAPPDTGSVTQLALDLFRRLSSRRPLTVIVDDLHWADESTRGLFGTLARGLGSCQAIVIGAYRADEIVRGHPLRAVLSAVHRTTNPEVVELLPLERAEAKQVAEAIGGGETSASFDDIFSRSDGNAFFLEELLAAPGQTVPQGVRETMFARLNGLGAEALELAEVASLDTALPADVLAAASKLEPDRFAAALDSLTESGMLVAASNGYGFRHALMREAVYDDVPPRRRAELHGRIALALEGTSRAPVAAIAMHWRGSGNHGKALESAVRAARQSYRIGAMPESADWYEVAFSLWHEVPDPESWTGSTFAALVLRADSSFAACRRFNRIIELLRNVLQRPSNLSGPERANLWIQLSLRAFQTDNEAVMLPLSLAALREARAAMDLEMDPSERIRLLSLFVLHATVRFGLAEEAEEAFSTMTHLAAGNPGAGHPLMAGASNWMRFSRGETELLEAMKNEPYTWASGTMMFGVHESLLLRLFGLHAYAVERSIAALGAAAEHGHVFDAAFNLERTVAASLTALGSWREAIARWESVKRQVGADALREWATVVVEGWGPLLVRSGHLDEAGYYRDAAVLDQFPYVPFLGADALVRVEFARIAKSPDDARVALTRAIDASRGHHTAAFGEPVAYAIGLIADASFGSQRADPDASSEIQHWFDRIQACLDNAPGRVNLYDLGVFLDQAASERARFLDKDSVESWEELAKRWHDLPRPYHEAYCRYRAAFALLMAPSASERKVSRQRASAHLQVASAISLDLGALYLQADIEALQKTAGLRPESPARRPAPKEDSASTRPVVTSRELEVLRLLVAGESNGQIAIRLGISVKTASVHVSNILRKLDAENRVEAAVRATRSGILEP